MFPVRTSLALLVLFAPLGLSLKCSNTTNTAEWSVSVICLDTSTASATYCYWDVINVKTNQLVASRVTSAADYQHFYCYDTFWLPSSTREYVYNIFFQNRWTAAFELQIVDPGEPTVENCKREVREGENVRCVCSTQNEGSPPPVISWEGQGTSPILLLDAVRREDSKTYKCEMMWGNRTKTVSYDLIVRTDSTVSDRPTTTVKPTTFLLSEKPATFPLQKFTESIDEVEKDENKNASSMPIGIIVAAAAAVLVLIVATTVIVIFIIHRKNPLTTKVENAQKQP